MLLLAWTKAGVFFGLTSHNPKGGPITGFFTGKVSSYGGQFQTNQTSYYRVADGGASQNFSLSGQTIFGSNSARYIEGTLAGPATHPEFVGGFTLNPASNWDATFGTPPNYADLDGSWNLVRSNAQGTWDTGAITFTQNGGTVDIAGGVGSCTIDGTAVPVETGEGYWTATINYVGSNCGNSGTFKTKIAIVPAGVMGSGYSYKTLFGISTANNVGTLFLGQHSSNPG